MRTGGALNLPAVLAGAVVGFLLLTMLIAGIIVGVVLLGRKAHKKETPTQKRAKHQQNSSITKFGRVTEEQKGKEVHIYDVVRDDAPTDGRAVLYQGLDVGTQDYVSDYTELRGGTTTTRGPTPTGRGRNVEEVIYCSVVCVHVHTCVCAHSIYVRSTVLT